jgi:hypothetical protein
MILLGILLSTASSLHFKDVLSCRNLLFNKLLFFSLLSFIVQEVYLNMLSWQNILFVVLFGKHVEVEGLAFILGCLRLVNILISFIWLRLVLLLVVVSGSDLRHFIDYYILIEELYLLHLAENLLLMVFLLNLKLFFKELLILQFPLSLVCFFLILRLSYFLIHHLNT